MFQFRKEEKRMGEMILRAGTPDDDNRHYLPESIYHSDIVVNENGNSSQPYPERLQEFKGSIPEGIESFWYEYVPKSYDPSRKTPLVVSLHGGLMTGWGQCIYTSWSYLAEREGLIVVYPNGHYNHFWTMEIVPSSPFAKFTELDGIRIPPSQTADENLDIKFILHVIEEVRKKYNIDEERIFIQGMSNGCGMTQQVSRYFGGQFAGAAFSAGPGRIGHLLSEDGSVINRGGPLGVWISHPELNGMGKNMEDEAETVRQDRYYWFCVNGVKDIPAITIEGEHNLAFFHGEKADMVFDDIKNRDHGQTLDEAFYYWDYLFSGTRKVNGKIVQEEPNYGRKGDELAAAFADGISKVWWKNQVKELPAAPRMWKKFKYHGLNGDTLTRGEYLMVPVSFLAELAGGSYEESDDRRTAKIILKDGTVLQFAEGSIACIMGDRLRSMYAEAIFRENVLMASVEWFAKYVLGLYVSSCNGVTYVTDHMADLSYFMADLIKDIMNDNMIPDDMIKHIRNTPAW